MPLSYSPVCGIETNCSMMHGALCNSSKVFCRLFHGHLYATQKRTASPPPTLSAWFTDMVMFGNITAQTDLSASCDMYLRKDGAPGIYRNWLGVHRPHLLVIVLVAKRNTWQEAVGRRKGLFWLMVLENRVHYGMKMWPQEKLTTVDLGTCLYGLDEKWKRGGGEESAQTLVYWCFAGFLPYLFSPGPQPMEWYWPLSERMFQCLLPSLKESLQSPQRSAY